MLRVVRGVLLEQVTTSRAGVTPLVINRTTWSLLAAAACFVVAGALLRPDLPHRDAVPALAGTAVVVAVVVHALRLRLRVPHYHLLQLLSTSMIATGVHLMGSHGTADAWLFAVVAVEAAFFFRAPAAAVHVAAVVLGLLVGLGGVPAVGAGDLLMMASALVTLTVVVRSLARATEAAGTDPLTLLPDRTSTTARLERAVAQVEHGSGVVLALVGIDHLRAYNQREGHAAGDALLQEAARRWRALLPRQAVLGRWGGDQFAVLVRGDVESAWTLVDAMHAALPEGRTSSAGLAVVELGEDVEDVVDHAEGALAAAKRARRGSSHQWAPGTPSGRGLQEALTAGHVQVHYQPVVRLADGATTGAEALVRWVRPDGTYVPPGDFLPQAEASGTIVALGRHVLERACGDAARWPVPAGGEPLSVAVNASGAELAEPDYAAWVISALRRSSLPGDRLVIEVVEGLLDEESASVVDNLHALRAAGVRLAVDDFGTGWSSLSRLARLPLDILKIDRSFVMTVEPGAEAPVCAGVVALAQALDLSIVAEGVETAHQADWLAGLGCQEAQGWLYAPALPDARFVERLRLADHRADAVAR